MKTSRKVVGTVFRSFMIMILVGIIAAANIVLPSNYRIVNSMLGGFDRYADNSGINSDGVDTQYNKADYTKTELASAGKKLGEMVGEEGIVLLKNDEKSLPIKEGTTLSLVSANSVDLQAATSLTGGISVKDILESSGFKINDTLWKFYSKGAGKNYGLAKGSISYGDAENFAINECPLSVMKDTDGVLNSMKGTKVIYVMKRVAGEGRDMPRSMYNHTGIEADRSKSYIEPDSRELEIIKYLNDNFDDVTVLVNTNAAMELGWINEYKNIHSVIYAPSGLQALGEILKGEVNPSGKTVDTFAADPLKSPAAQNIGDYEYYDENGKATGYNYVNYEEGIYVGYHYYETRYEDSVLRQGNAGDFNYDKEVVYPFGYGLSYTTFQYSNMISQWSGNEGTFKVDVTNTGDVAGKEAVELYMQSPYTQYDKDNGVEKPSVELVGYEKTKILNPGETQTVRITVSKDQLKAYDVNKAKTYVMDAGTYYFTAATDAHNAVKNILAAKGASADGDAALTKSYVPENKMVDTTTYATDSRTGVQVTNQLSSATAEGTTYLTRKDWSGTFPTHDGKASDVISTWGNEINGTDAGGKKASYTYEKTASADLLKKLKSTDSNNTEKTAKFGDRIVYGADNGLKLTDLRGKDFDDPMWNQLLDQLTIEDYNNTIGWSGYGIEAIKSVNSPFAIDADTASGLIYGAACGVMLPNPMTLAQTWNKDLATQYGNIIGNDGLLGGANGWYAPSMNIHRTPFSGRNGEYYSEDGFLSGSTAALEVKAVAKKGLYTYIKHFAFNDQENHRGDRVGQLGLATWLNEQAAREIYLKPFEMCMKNGNITLNYVEKKKDGTFANASREIPACQAVMTAFNRIGATWTGGSYDLISGILRNEWGFNGLIITDNANTGVFMDCRQMIEAGSDIKLTSIRKDARYTFNSKDAVEFHYARTAMHRMLYTLADSNALNGAMPGAVLKEHVRLVTKVRVIITVLLLLIIVRLMYMIFRIWKPSAKMLEKWEKKIAEKESRRQKKIAKKNA